MLPLGQLINLLPYRLLSAASLPLYFYYVEKPSNDPTPPIAGENGVPDVYCIKSHTWTATGWDDDDDIIC